MLASLGAGRLVARTGRYKIFPVVGSVLMLAGMGLLTTLGADTPLWHTDVFMAIFGIGLGFNMQSLVLAMQNAVPAKDMGVASAASSFFRSVGGTLGTAIFLSILFSLAGSKITAAYAKAATSPAYLAAARAHPGQVASLRQHLGGGLDDTVVPQRAGQAAGAPVLRRVLLGRRRGLRRHRRPPRRRDRPVRLPQGSPAPARLRQSGPRPGQRG